MGWGGRWTVLAWCETRNGYRNFRIDRMEAVERLDRRFEISDRINIAHYYRTELGLDDIV